jgi:hypothetical protein
VLACRVSTVLDESQQEIHGIRVSRVYPLVPIRVIPETQFCEAWSDIAYSGILSQAEMPGQNGVRNLIMSRSRLYLLLAVVPSIAIPDTALAYIGPGAGLGAIAVTIALVLGVLLLVIGLVWYPLKRLLKRPARRISGNNGIDESR